MFKVLKINIRKIIINKNKQCNKILPLKVKMIILNKNLKAQNKKERIIRLLKSKRN